jgi:hypothetical protein
MKLNVIIFALWMSIGLRANQTKEFTYDWLVEQFSQNQFTDIESIKKHCSFYTQLVQDDLYDCKQRLAHWSGRVIQFLAGIACLGSSCLVLPKVLCSWPRRKIKDGHYLYNGCYV